MWEFSWDEYGDRLCFTRALILSALLHGALLTLWKAAPRDWGGGGSPVLSVTFKTVVAPESHPALLTPEARANRDAQGALLLRPEAGPQVVPASSAHPAADLTHSAGAAKSSTATTLASQSPVQKGTPSPGSNEPDSTKSSGVRVLLTIGEQGRVNQIIWNQLPALTDEQLRRLETSIRTRTYAESMSGQSIDDMIDVRAFLKAETAPQ